MADERPVLVVAALAVELRAVLRGLSRVRRDRGARVPTWTGWLGERAVMVVRSGVGSGKAARAVLVTEELPLALLSIGCAGGLDPAVGCRDIVVAEMLIWEERGATQVYRVDEGWRCLLEQAAQRSGAKWHRGGVYCTAKPILSAKEKRLVGNRTKAVAVEMEGRGLVSAARELGVPVAMMRAVLDPVEETVPRLPFLPGMTVTSRLRAAGDLRSWRDLIRLAGQIRGVVAVLTQAIAALENQPHWGDGTCSDGPGSL